MAISELNQRVFFSLDTCVTTVSLLMLMHLYVTMNVKTSDFLYLANIRFQLELSPVLKHLNGVLVAIWALNRRILSSPYIEFDTTVSWDMCMHMYVTLKTVDLVYLTPHVFNGVDARSRAKEWRLGRIEGTESTHILLTRYISYNCMISHIGAHLCDHEWENGRFVVLGNTCLQLALMSVLEHPFGIIIASCALIAR